VIAAPRWLLAAVLGAAAWAPAMQLHAAASAVPLAAVLPRHAPPPAIPAQYAQPLARLDCDGVTASDVANILSHVPAPRIVLLQGSVPIVTMEPFARFLIGMGYPEARLRNPRDGALSNDSFAHSTELAGALAFDYERSGLAPMLIGHSQGGSLAIRVLHELAGAFHPAIAVVDPATGDALPRTTIVDPYTGLARPVVGLRIAFAAALATGWLPRLLLGQWSMLPRLRTIPDTVTEFTGFDLANDPIAGNLFGVTPYSASGTARVRNVLLPDAYSHVELPRVDHLAQDPTTRAWIDAFVPGKSTSPPAGDTTNIVHAADVWHSVKRHWCLQAQRLLTLKQQ